LILFFRVPVGRKSFESSFPQSTFQPFSVAKREPALQYFLFFIVQICLKHRLLITKRFYMIMIFWPWCSGRDFRDDDHRGDRGLSLYSQHADRSFLFCCYARHRVRSFKL